MRGSQFAELCAFVAVAEHRNFTKAAAQLGVSRPSLSKTIRSLEDRLGVRLLNRTTRSVALTEAGERLLADAQPVLDGTNRAFEAVNAFRDKPTGTLRLSMTRAVASLLVGSLLPQFLAQFPDIKLEVSADDTHSDIVSSRFDAGIRIGERIAKDMIAVRVLEEQHRVAVASPAYLAHHPAPATPQDLHAHNCVRLRSDWDALIQPWVFENADRRLEIDVDGSLVLNDWSLVVNAAVAGIGVGYVPERLISSHIANGHLVRLLENWRGIVSGVFLYYPSRRQMPGALRAFIDFMRAQCDAVSATRGGTNLHSGSNIRADSHSVAPTP
jgi:DNA-binding transcriptional LysR family regulator